MFDTIDEAKLESLIERHSQVVREQKEAAQGKGVRNFGCLHVFDDMADDASVVKRSSNSVFLKQIIPFWASPQHQYLVKRAETIAR